MKQQFYAVYDKAIAAYMRPFVAQSDGQAVRLFKDETENNESPFFKHPEDYALFRLGVWNDQDGKITPEEPHPLARAHEFAKSNASYGGSE